MEELSINDPANYRDYLGRRPEEWQVLDSYCTIPISRFYRDRGVFDYLRAAVLPALAATVSARGETRMRAWVCGCASGEEAYTLNIVWRAGIAENFPNLPLEIIATDVDPAFIGRCH
jgi:chemotaxis protein methyltransferase CheR